MKQSIPKNTQQQPSPFSKLSAKSNISKYYIEQSFQCNSPSVLYEIIDFVQLIIIWWDYPSKIDFQIGIPKSMLTGNKHIEIKHTWDIVCKNLYMLNQNITIHKIQQIESKHIICSICAN